MVKGMSRRVCCRSIAKGRMAAVMPRISRVLQIFDPITLPKAMSPLPLRADEMLMNSSGDDVPMPMMVKPMMKLLRCAFLAIATDESTRTLAPSKSKPRPAIRRI